MADPSDDNAQALWVIAPGQAEIRPVPLPRRDNGALLVRALVSGISRGTESLVLQGKVPESEWGRMRCPFQEGEFPFPVKYGYAMVGIVEDGPAERLGQRVLCLYPHQSRFVVPAAAAFRVPDSVSTEQAALGPQMETALNATWDAAPRIGDRIAVVGGGVIGCLVAYLCARIPGTDVTLIDIDPNRQSVADRLGFRFAMQADDPTRGCDLVFHTSGNPQGLDLALSLAGYEATIVELSWYGQAPATVYLGGAFHSQRLTLLSSQVGAVSPARRARWSHARRLALAMSLCADPALDILVAEETHFAEMPARYPAILATPGALCHLIRY